MSPGDNVELFEQIRVLLPKYLTPAEKDDLFEELKRFPDNASFYFDREDLRSELQRWLRLVGQFRAFLKWCLAGC